MASRGSGGGGERGGWPRGPWRKEEEVVGRSRSRKSVESRNVW